MLINEVAKTAGITKDTIRYYDKLGLLEFEGSSRQLNNYRDYPREIFDRLLLIKQAKTLGFTLDEICHVFKKWENNSLTKEEKTGLFIDKLKAVEQKITELKKVRVYLKTKLKRIG
jgi:MerR family copper efflux transcriptional regulator